MKLLVFLSIHPNILKAFLIKVLTRKEKYVLHVNKNSRSLIEVIRVTVQLLILQLYIYNEIIFSRKNANTTFIYVKWKTILTTPNNNFIQI